jgi:hypothetical protein
MAIARVQGAGNTETSQATSLAVTLSSTTAGNLVAVLIQMHGTGTPAISTVTDNLSSTYTAGPATNGSGDYTGLYYLLGNPGGITTITVTANATVTMALWAWEFSGVATVSAVDGTPGTGGPTSSTAVTTAAITTTNAADVLLGGIGWLKPSVTITGTPSFGSGSLTQETQQTSSTVTQPTTLQPVYQIVAATGTWTLTATLSAAAYWATVAIALEGAGSGSGETSALQPGWAFPNATTSQTYSGTLSTSLDWVAAAVVYSIPAATAPAQVTGVVGVGGNRLVALTWNVPGSGGSPITSYTVTPYIAGVAQTPITGVPATAPPYNVAGLTNGTAYAFTVAAVNAVGTGTASSLSAYSPTVPSTVPDQPVPPTVQAGDTVCNVTATAPGNGGATITGYTFNCYQGASLFGSQTQAGLTYQFTNLTDGTTYGFSVIATNANGNGPESSQTLATPQSQAFTFAGAPTGSMGALLNIPCLPL